MKYYLSYEAYLGILSLSGNHWLMNHSSVDISLQIEDDILTQVEIDGL